MGVKWTFFLNSSPSGLLVQLQPQEISPPPTANLDRSNDKVYENVTGLVKAVIEMSNRIQPAAPEEYVPMVKVRSPSQSRSSSDLYSTSHCPLQRQNLTVRKYEDVPESLYNNANFKTHDCVCMCVLL